MRVVTVACNPLRCLRGKLLNINRHDDVIKWKHFPRNWPFVWRIHRSFPAQRPVTRSFDVFFDLRLNKRLWKQSWGRWFETLSRPLWRRCNGKLDSKRRCGLQPSSFDEKGCVSEALSYVCWSTPTHVTLEAKLASFILVRRVNKVLLAGWKTVLLCSDQTLRNLLWCRFKWNALLRPLFPSYTCYSAIPLKHSQLYPKYWKIDTRITSLSLWYGVTVVHMKQFNSLALDIRTYVSDQVHELFWNCFQVIIQDYNQHWFS